MHCDSEDLVRSKIDNRIAFIIFVRSHSEQHPQDRNHGLQVDLERCCPTTLKVYDQIKMSIVIFKKG